MYLSQSLYRMNSSRRAATQTRKNTNFAVMYESLRVNGKLLTRTQTKDAPTIAFKPKKGKYYTIMMYDIHSPSPAYLHYMAVNITDPAHIVPFIAYQPPSPPPKDTHYHVYLFELYEQPGFLTFDPVGSRGGFDVAAFVGAHKLHRIAQRGFYVNPRAAATALGDSNSTV